MAVSAAAIVAQAARSDTETVAMAGPGPGAGPERYSGPQGGVGQFVVQCLYSHSATDDPIVVPDERGMAHRHDFYGATRTRADSTPAALRRGKTTCDKSGDTAAYWHPTLSDHGVAVRPRSLAAYYRAAPGVPRSQVRPFPFGLAMIAGHPHAHHSQTDGAAGWTCGARSDLSARPPDCPGTAPLHLVLTFPDCWDGVNIDAPDHRSHVAYSARGRCADSHPVHVPQLTVSVTFPITGSDHDLALSSGSVLTAHGDFLNAWDPAALAREIAMCIGRNAVCDLASNRQESPLFQTR